MLLSATMWLNNLLNITIFNYYTYLVRIERCIPRGDKQYARKVCSGRISIVKN